MKKRRTRPSSLVVFGLAMTVVTSGLPSRALGQAIHFVTPLEDSFPFSIFNECTGEQVSGTVNIRGQIRITSDSAAGFHAQVHRTFLAEGIAAASGTKYVSSQTVSETVYGRFLEELSHTVAVNFRFISAGPSDNDIVHGLFHTTVNANGEVTSFVDNFSAECRG